MPNSHVSNHVHVVFGTMERACLISKELQPKLWAYMAGIAKSGIHAVAIGGTDDHVHALLVIPALLSIAKVVQALKANSSRWINEHREYRFE
jgi:putative transposase